jgi:hypothetical protein
MRDAEYAIRRTHHASSLSVTPAFLSLSTIPKDIQVNVLKWRSGQSEFGLWRLLHAIFHQPDTIRARRVGRDFDLGVEPMIVAQPLTRAVIPASGHIALVFLSQGIDYYHLVTR